MKKWIKWVIAAVVILALAGAIYRALSVRSEQQKAVAASAAAPKTRSVELAASDYVLASTQDLKQGFADIRVPEGGQLGICESTCRR